MTCHGLDFDDTHEASIAHVATVVVPAAIAAAEAVARRGPTLAAIVAGDRGGDPHRHGGAGAASTPRLPSHGRLRRLRRDRRRLPSCGMDAETTRRRSASRAASRRASSSTSPTARPRSRCTRAGPPRRASRPPARRAGGRGRDRPRGPLRPPPTHVDVAHDMARQLADLGERWESPNVAYQALSRVPLPARRGRCGRGGDAATSRPTRSSDRRRSPGRRADRARAAGEKHTPRTSTTRSSASRAASRPTSCTARSTS